MRLNDFLKAKLDVTFNDKYNELASAEVLSHKERYPLIADEIIGQMKAAEEVGKKWNYITPFFDCEDDDYCGGFEETYELYKAFVRALSKDIRDNPNLLVPSLSVWYGIVYLESPDISNILFPEKNLLGCDQILVFPNMTNLISNVYYPLVPGEIHFGHIADEEYFHSFYQKNVEVLNSVTKGFRSLCEEDTLFMNEFDNQILYKHPIKMKNGIVGYPCDMYEILIHGNVLKFYSTERGFDALSALRLPLMDSLTKEQREHHIVRTIETVYQ